MKKVFLLLFVSTMALVSCQKEKKASPVNNDLLSSIDLIDESFETPIVKHKMLWYKTKSDALNFYRHLQKQLDVAEYTDLAEDESSEERFLSLVEQKLGFYSLRKHQKEGVQSRSNEEFIGDELEKALLNPDYAVGVGNLTSIFHKEEAYEVMSADPETLADVYATPVDEKLPLDKFNGNIKLIHSESGRDVITGGPEVLWPPVLVTDRSEPNIEIGAVDLCGDPFKWYVSVDWESDYGVIIDWGDGSPLFNTVSGTDYYPNGHILTHDYSSSTGPVTITVTVFGPNKTYVVTKKVDLDEACFKGWKYYSETESLGSWSLTGEVWARKNLYGNRCGSTIISRHNGDKSRRFKKMGLDGIWRFSDDNNLCSVDKVDFNFWDGKKKKKTHYIFNIGGSAKHITDDVTGWYEMDVPGGTLRVDLSLWYCGL